MSAPMTPEEVARLHRESLIEIGCTCTQVEVDPLDGSAKFCVTGLRSDGEEAPPHSRKFLKGGTLEVTNLNGTPWRPTRRKNRRAR